MGNELFSILDEINLIKKYYYDDNLSSIEIGKILNCNHNTIVRTLKRNNCIVRKKSKHTNSKYSVNENYFNTIDTYKKAYFLGLLYSDGSLYFKNKSVSLSLSVEDDYIINEFIKDIEFTGKIKLLELKNENHSNAAYVQIYNENFYYGAIKSGLYDNKSLTLTSPTFNIVPKKLISHFIRGYFDGDGCAYLNIIRNRKRNSFIGTFEFLSSLKKFLIDNFNINDTKMYQKSKNNTFDYRINKKSDVELITNFLYQDSNGLFLKRKYNKLTTKL